MNDDPSKARFYAFLNQPRFGCCRGVLPYNFALLLPFLILAQQCFERVEAGCGLLFLVSPLLILAHEVVFRRSRLPQRVAESYDALFEDISTEVSCQSFKEQAAACFCQVAHLGQVVLDFIGASVWFCVALLVSLIHTWCHVLVARTRSACDQVSVRKFLLLTQVHSIRAPSIVLN